MYTQRRPGFEGRLSGRDRQRRNLALPPEPAAGIDGRGLDSLKKEGLCLPACGIVPYPQVSEMPGPRKTDPKGANVANYCVKCGKELSPGVQFCQACGTPLAAAPGFTAVPTQPVYPVQPPPPPPSSGTSAVKVILIIVAVFVGLGVLGAGAFGFFVWRVAHAVHVSGSGNEVTFNGPHGKLSVNGSQNFTTSDLGTEIYPGAQSGKGSLRMSLPTGTMVSAVYVTSDSRDQVLAFYKDKFKGSISTYDTANGSVLSYNNGQQESVVVTITSEPSEYDGKTQIHIVHTTTTKAS